MIYYKTMDKWIMCVVALILGMLLANMLKNVCGCKVVEGKGSEPCNFKCDCPEGYDTDGNCYIEDPFFSSQEFMDWEKNQCRIPWQQDECNDPSTWEAMNKTNYNIQYYKWVNNMKKEQNWNDILNMVMGDGKPYKTQYDKWCGTCECNGELIKSCSEKISGAEGLSCKHYWVMPTDIPMRCKDPKEEGGKCETSVNCGEAN
jgi:hypothetical protein